MPLSPRPLSSLLLLALLGGTSAAALAAPQKHGSKLPQSSGQQDGHGKRERSPHNDDALSDSVRKIERSTRGQVLSAERVPYDGRSLNRIKVVDERGRVRVYMDDPQQPQAQRPGAPTRSDDD